MNKNFEQEKKIDKPVVVQVRKDAGGNMLHLQVYYNGDDVIGNRAYGWAEKFTVPEVVTEDLRLYNGTLYPSFATDSEVYIRGIASFHTYTDGTQLQLEIKWSDGLNFNNKDYGYILDLPIVRFKPMLEFMAQAGVGNIWLDETRWLGEEE